jgi:alpha-mannosidase
LQLLDDTPKRWPAWEIDSTTVWEAPRAVVGGPAQIEIIENGPARVALRVIRRAGNSTFTQIIRLAAAGKRVEIVNEVDWREQATLLKAAFPLTSSNDSVTYDLGLGTIKRGMNNGNKYEVPAQQWADLTLTDDRYGVTVLNDCKYGWDHPDKNTLRLSLIHTPGISPGWEWVGDQKSQDLGRHQFTYAIYPHYNFVRGAISNQAASLNQPLLAFQIKNHNGSFGSSMSFVEKMRVEYPDRSTDGMIRPAIFTDDGLNLISIKAIREAENSNEIVIRLQELNETEIPTARLWFSQPALSAQELDGAEEPIGSAQIDSGALVTSFAPYQTRTFSVKLASLEKMASAPFSTPLRLPYNLDGFSSDGEANGGDYNGEGIGIPGELLPDTLTVRGATFITGPKREGQVNLVRCDGQKILLPYGEFNRLDLLICATGGQPAQGVFKIGGKRQEAWIPDGGEWIGQWNSRLIGDSLVADLAGITPAFATHTPLGWTATHTHNASGENIAYRYANFYLIRLDVPKNTKSLTLPNDLKLRILAATLVKTEVQAVRPAQPLYDEFNATLTNHLVSRSNFIDSTIVEITSPIPGAEVRFSVDGTDPTLRSPLYAGRFSLTKTTTVKTRAFKEGMDDSYVATSQVFRHVPIPAVEIQASAPGLICSYFETDSTLEALPDFSTLNPIREEKVESFSIPAFARKEFYALKLTGWVNVPTDGMYRFATTSDDGSALYIGEKLVVNNDGIHGEWEESGEIALGVGWHPITVLMFQGRGGKTLSASIEGPGLPKTEIPAGMVSHSQK